MFRVLRPDGWFCVSDTAAAGFADVEIATAVPIDLPDAALAAHMDAPSVTAFRRSGIGLRSVTVVGRKREQA